MTPATVKRREQEQKAKSAKRSSLNVATMGQQPSTWPMASDAAGVDPSQIKEQMAHDTKEGVPTEYTRSGEPILTSASHRKKYMRAQGLYDRNAGYGDPEPVNQ